LVSEERTVANHKQALKRHRQGIIRAERNRYYISTVRTRLKRARLAIGEGEKTAATEAVGQVVTFLDKIASKGIIHKNRANRLKSRLTRRLNTL
jgi:small subunit ribosomal protein S20